MYTFEVTLRDQHVEQVTGADTYQPERDMTTFFLTGNARSTIDCWATRVASFRTDQVLMIRRVACADESAPLDSAEETRLSTPLQTGASVPFTFAPATAGPTRPRTSGRPTVRIAV